MTARNEPKKTQPGQPNDRSDDGGQQPRGGQPTNPGSGQNKRHGEDQGDSGSPERGKSATPDVGEEGKTARRHNQDEGVETP